MKAAADFLNNAAKPVLVGGVKLRPAHAEDAFLEFANASGEQAATRSDKISAKRQ